MLHDFFASLEHVKEMADCEDVPYMRYRDSETQVSYFPLKGNWVTLQKRQFHVYKEGRGWIQEGKEIQKHCMLSKDRVHILRKAHAHILQVKKNH